MLTQRFGSDLQTDQTFVDDFIDVIRRNPGSCDEVWLASNYGFPPMEVHEKTVEKLMVTADKLRRAGIRVSLQISNTIGHGQYMSSCNNTGLVYDGAPTEHMVGPDGTVAGYCFCWNGAHFRDYTVREMRVYAKLKPYRVWIDDDVRASNHDPVNMGCFCDRCIGKFNRLYNSGFDRAGLVREINRGEPVWRERWVKFLRDGIGGFVEQLTAAICDVSPETRMGLQYCAHGGYTGYGFAYIFDAMRRASGKPVGSRPGGGAYDDHDPRQQLNKAYFMAFQNSMLPDDVTEIRPEIENLPFTYGTKSPAGTCMETSLYMATGANAMSYSMLMHLTEPMDYYERTFRGFSQHRDYWNALTAANESTFPAGLGIYASRSAWKRKLGENERDFAWRNECWRSGTELARMGIPLCYGAENRPSPVYLLHPDCVASLSDEEIKTLLASPVFTDGRTVAYLAEHGYGDRFSAAAVPVDTLRFRETATSHPLCGDAAGAVFSDGFGRRDNFFLRDLGGTEPLTAYTTASLDTPANDPGTPYPYGVAAAIVHTASGGSWVVCGKEPWRDNYSFAHRNLLLRAIERAAGCPRIPAILETRQQAATFPRENGAMQTTSVSVLNMAVGMSEPMRLRIRRPAGSKAVWMDESGKNMILPVTRDGDELLVETPQLLSWSVGTVFLQNETEA